MDTRDTQLPSPSTRIAPYSADFDRLPLLRPPQLNNVQDVSTVAWFSTQDGKPYVRIRLRTKGTVCRACFHDLSPRKQQDLIDRLRAKREGRLSLRPGAPPAAPPGEEESERLLQLIIYMEKHKRPLAPPPNVGAERAVEEPGVSEGDDDFRAPPGTSLHRESVGPTTSNSTSPRPPPSLHAGSQPPTPVGASPFPHPPPPAPGLIHLPAPFPSSPYYHPLPQSRPYRYPGPPEYPSYSPHPRRSPSIVTAPAAEPSPQADDGMRYMHEECARLRTENHALREEVLLLRRHTDMLYDETRKLREEMSAARSVTSIGGPPGPSSTKVSSVSRPIILPPRLEEVLSRHLPTVSASVRDVLREALLAMDGELRNPGMQQ
ncbi:hypothetical protein SpCBS45565_g01828 [Spizellomyces sp. 'palustris']|nr:hypothetical protein SpCBS45565_g01828 [Spizellomyces sp. 'palustris']